MNIRTILLFAIASFASLTAFSQVRSVENIGIDEVSVIELGANNDAWVGSASQGILFYKGSDQTWTPFNTSNTVGVGDDSITTITTAAIGTPLSQYAFIGTRGASCYIKDGQCTGFTALTDKRVVGLAYKEDTLWIISRGLITSVDSNQHIANTYAPPFTPVTATQLSGKNCPGFWAGTANNGCFFTSNGTNFNYIDTSAVNGHLVDNRVNALNMDNNCIALLVGTKGGFSKCPMGGTAACQNYTTANGLPQNDIATIGQDCKGNIWLGTRDSGLVIFTPPSTFTRMTTANGLTTNQITAISFTPQPTCTGWVGLKDGNIAVLDTNKTVVQILNSVPKIDANEVGVHMFPQPATSQLNFVFEKELKQADLYLTDISGRTVQHLNINNTTHATADVSTLQAGMYLYQVYSDKQLLKAGKVEVVK